MLFMDANNPYAEDFGPFDGRVWLNTAHQGPLPESRLKLQELRLNEKPDHISFGMRIFLKCRRG